MVSVLILVCGFLITFSQGTPVNQHASDSIDGVINVYPVRAPLRDFEGNRQPVAIESLSTELKKRHADLYDKGASDAGDSLSDIPRSVPDSESKFYSDEEGGSKFSLHQMNGESIDVSSNSGELSPKYFNKAINHNSPDLPSVSESSIWEMKQRQYHSIQHTSIDHQGSNETTNEVRWPALNTAEANESTDGAKRRSRRAVSSDPKHVWTDGIIPYEIEPIFEDSTIAMILRGMRAWESATCLTFVQREPRHRAYLIFTKKPCGCCSFVGRQSDTASQTISLAPDCESDQTVMHELGHALGFYHEHARPDRDRYVKIIERNILPDALSNYKQKKPSEVNSFGKPYDFDSIMHYASDLFAIPGATETIRLRPGVQRPTFGQLNTLSAGDISQMNTLYKCPVCQHTIVESAGSFELANPNQPRPNTCQWRILANTGESIELRFTRFNLLSQSSHGVCNDEYVEVWDGYYSGSKLLGRYCGQTVPLHTEIASSTRMLIRYKRSVTRSRSTFKATYKVKCDTTLKGPEDTFTSPGYPNDYQANKRCVWKIQVKKKHGIVLTFKEFNLEGPRNCSSDYVEVFDGRRVDSSLLRKLCGVSIPKRILSRNNELTVRFTSNGAIQKPGFLANFRQVTYAEIGNCATTLDGCQHICVSKARGYSCECEAGYILQADGKSCEMKPCGGELRAANGVITSPFFPNAYPPDLTCTWEIVVPPRFTVVLTVESYKISMGETRTCTGDYLKITRNVSPSVLRTATLCGSGSGTTFNSTTNKMTVTFVTDSDTQSTGFKARFAGFNSADKRICATIDHGCEHDCVATSQGFFCQCNDGYKLQSDRKSCKTMDSCGGEIDAEKGTFTSPGFPHGYVANLQCTWNITVPTGYAVSLTLDSVDMDGAKGCPNDYLEIKYHNTLTSRMRSTLCGTGEWYPFVSKTNMMTVIFHTKLTTQKAGFRARFAKRPQF